MTDSVSCHCIIKLQTDIFIFWDIHFLFLCQISLADYAAGLHVYVPAKIANQ